MACVAGMARALFQGHLNCLDDFFHRDFLHAAKIDGALAKKAGTALDLLADHHAARTTRAGECRFRGPENRHQRSPNKIGEMHRACIVRNKNRNSRQEIHQIFKSGFTRQIGNVGYAQ